MRPIARASAPSYLIAVAGLLLAATVAGAPTLTAQTIYVDCTNTTGIEDGTAAYPYDTIQEGIDAAVDGDTVVVQPCTYHENIDFLGRAITVTSVDPLDPIVVQTTVIDGVGIASVVTFATAETATSVLQGFTITNGYDANGGGVYCSGASPTITDCVIAGNSASGYGGGIYCDSSSLTATRNTIASNSALHGGGVYSTASSPTITNSAITGNQATGGADAYGGGIYCYDSDPVIAQNTISGNIASAQTTVATGYGGGVCLLSGYSAISMTNNVIAGNQANADGGGIYADDCTLTISNCTIANNTECAVRCGSGCSATVCNCILWPDSICGSFVTVTYSDTHVYWAGEGNISADPAFGAAYRLLRHSPCIDAGAAACSPADDIDGDPRPFPAGGLVDMGADEWVGERPWPCVPGTVYVDCDSACPTPDGSEACPYPLIQDGIDAACDGYTVVVQPGIYYENIVFRGKAITVASTDPLDPSVVDATVIDGGAFGSVVAFANGEGPGSVLEGFTITNGLANYTGGGVYCGPSSSPTVRNTAITANYATDSGGGIACYHSSPTIESNTISADNAAYYFGGGVYCYASSPTIRDNLISANDSGYGNGGGIACVVSSAPLISGNLIANNVGKRGGGLYCGNSSHATIINNVISGNNATESYGGGIYCYYSSPTIGGNVFTGNTAKLAGGGIYCVLLSWPTLTNNVVAGNSAMFSGGLRCYDRCAPDVINCTIVDNVNGDITARNNSPLTVTNSIVGSPADVDGTSPITITYSNVCTTVPGPWPGEGNICADPMFLDPGSGDYHLRPGSPCIETGLTASAPADDIDGEPRPWPVGGAADMGADEWVPTCEISYDPAAPEACGTITFYSGDVDPDGTGLSETWDFGDGATASGDPVAHQYAAPNVYTVSVTVCDSGGLGCVTCTTPVAVVDITPPVITQCAGNQTLSADASCQASIPDLTGQVVATDDCDLVLDVAQSPSAGTVVGLGDTVVMLTVTDDGGNSAACTATVTVADDTAPTITQCAGNQTPSAGATCEATLPDLTGEVAATDNCDSLLDVTQSPAAGTTVGLGDTVVTLTATDDAGNSASCTATVTVSDDSAPVITQCPVDRTLSADATCQAVIPDLVAETVASDNCTAAPAITQSPSAGTVVGLGDTVVTLTVTDDAGNSATCTATITVADDSEPVITQCADDRTLSADAGCQAAIPDLTGEVTATDNCTAAPAVTQSPSAGTVVGLGDTLVTLTVTDDAGNSAACTATVTVADDTAPTITQCAGSRTLSAGATCEATLPDLTSEVAATDNCDPLLDVTQSPAAGTTVGLGDTVVTLTATDDAGNSASCTATVTVSDDSDPVIAQCPVDRTLSADATCQAVIPDLVAETVASDNCTAAPAITQSPSAGTVVGLGDTVVTLTVTDDAGNSATCTATITVADDSDPVITQCAGDRTLSADAGCQAVIPDLTGEVTATDNCTAAPAITQSPSAGTVVGLGDTVVTLTVTDDGGNSAACTATVTVIDDTAPTITECPADRPLSADGNGQAVLPDLTTELVAVDNCDTALTVTQSPPPGTVLGLGETVVSLTVSDDAGGSATCQVTVTVAWQFCMTLAGGCWHMITIPCHPIDTDPWELFDELRPPQQALDLLSGNLHRYDHNTLGYATYHEFAPERFGAVTPGDGYWLWLFEDITICYWAYCSESPEVVHYPSPGWYLTGSPRPQDTYLDDTLWYQGIDGPFSFSTIMNSWVQDPLSHWSCLDGQYLSCGLLPIDDDPYLRAFQGYWMYAFVDDVTMETPP